jgi:hypothetical protein
MERVHNSLLSAVLHDKPQQESMSKQDGPRRVGLKKLVELSKSEQRPASRNIRCVIAAPLLGFYR